MLATAQNGVTNLTAVVTQPGDAAVPEPATLVLLATGLAGMVLGKRKK